MTIEVGKVLEFQLATKARPTAREDARPTVPPTFLTTVRNWWPPTQPLPDLPLDRRRMLHASEEYRFHGEFPRAGDVLTVSSRLGPTWQKDGSRGGTLKFASIVVEFRNESGELVAEQVTTMVETAKTPAGSADD
jgi:hypothetical protein